MQLDHDQLHRLLEVLADSDIQEFRLEGDDFRLEVRRNLPAQAVMAPVMSAPLPAAVQARGCRFRCGRQPAPGRHRQSQ